MHIAYFPTAEIVQIAYMLMEKQRERKKKTDHEIDRSSARIAENRSTYMFV